MWNRNSNLSSLTLTAFMRDLLLCLLAFIIFSSCKKDRTETNLISAEIDGVSYSTSHFAITKNGDELVAFRSDFEGTVFVGINIDSRPEPYMPGNYVFRESGTTPATLLGFRAQPQLPHTRLEWSTGAETGLAFFQIERSLSPDITQFSVVGTRTASNSGNSSAYEYLDTTAVRVASYYYRLKMVDTDGSFSYSNVIHFNGQMLYTAYLFENGIAHRGFNGNVRISSHDRSGRRVTGSFSFDAKTEAGVIRRVRNGKFELTY